MWLSHKKITRLQKAIKLNGINVSETDIKSFFDLLVEKKITDSVLNAMILNILFVLEGPACTMTHCKFYAGHQHTRNCSKSESIPDPFNCKIFKTWRISKLRRDSIWPYTRERQLDTL